MTKDSALKLALDAIETYSPEYMHGLPKKHYIEEIKKALKQSEHEDILDIDVRQIGLDV